MSEIAIVCHRTWDKSQYIDAPRFATMRILAFFASQSPVAVDLEKWTISKKPWVVPVSPIQAKPIWCSSLYPNGTNYIAIENYSPVKTRSGVLWKKRKKLFQTNPLHDRAAIVPLNICQRSFDFDDQSVQSA